MIKHISLDLWNTLMTSNPEFSIKRINYLHSNYFQNISENQLCLAIEEIGDIVDDINMSTGISIKSEKMYQMLFDKFNLKISLQKANDIYASLEILFLEFNPILLYNDKHLFNVFDKLLANGISLNISSNTAFIKGETLRKSLKHLGLYKYFNFFIFSDEINASKPSKIFFNNLIDKCKVINVKKQHIIHIGDSKRADCEGASNNNILSKHIDFKQESLVDFLNNNL